MASRLKRLALAALTALTAVGLGAPCAMAEGTAAATAFISVRATDGTTLDGRTFKAYRLGSYGAADIRTDEDSGDRYATSIPVTSDPDRRDVLDKAASDSDLEGDDPLAAAWASNDSGKLESFARSLSTSLADTEADASVDGAGEIGPFVPGVYLLTGSDGSACLSGTLPSEGVSDRVHALGIAEFEGDQLPAEAEPQANSDGELKLLDSDASTGTTGRTRRMRMAARAAQAQTYHRLFDGTVTSSALDNEDPAISIYTGGNLTWKHNVETEGSVIVNGNMVNGVGLLAGKANWGMGYTPPKNSVMLAVGGNYTSSGTSGRGYGWVSGKGQIGGSNNQAKVVKDKDTITANGLWDNWLIEGQTDPSIRSNMGHDAALKVNVDGKGTIVDYNNYVSRQLQPLSNQLAAETPTGTVSYERVGDSTETVWVGVGVLSGQSDNVKVSNEGRIKFTGDGQKHRQVFTLDLDELARKKSELNVVQWGVDFENVPGTTAIVINMKGSGSRTWDTGWRYWVNGKKVNIAVNQTNGTYQDFRTLSSRVLWNWTDASDVTYDESHGILGSTGYTNKLDGKQVYHSTGYRAHDSAGKNSNLPGTVLAPKSNMTMMIDQNGRLLVGKNLTMDVWEHHNNPWVGFDDNNTMSVDAATTASHDGVDVGTSQAVHDTISLRNNGRKYGAKIAKATVRLNYSTSTDGKAASKTSAKATGSVQVGAGQTVSVNSPNFTPGDLGMSTWQPGRYWFDLSVAESDLSVTGTAGYETSDVSDIHSLSGLSDTSEQWTIPPTSAPTISTRATAGNATVGGTQAVHDSITITNTDRNRAITVAKVTTTLHMKAGDRKASKTVGPVTIPAGGSKTFDSADFTPSDLNRKCWSGKTPYWFDATVAATDITYPSGVKALTADLVHDGSNDKAQRFTLTFFGGNGALFSTQAQNTFPTAGGNTSVHDRLVVTTGPDLLGDDLNVTVTLNWARSQTATTAEKSATKSDVIPAGSSYRDLPAIKPSDMKMTNGWQAGHYWYVVTIPQQDGVSESIVLDGLKKDVDKESWTAVNTFTLDLAKLAYIGQPGHGRWSNEPVKSAAFTIVETTDQTGKTNVSNASVKTVTTDANGSVHLLDGTVSATGTRWYKLVETKAPASYKTPDNGTYWMVKVTGSPDGATIGATGSDKAATALLKGVDKSTVTVGNQLNTAITPPMTGGRYDVARAAAMAGTLTLLLLAVGYVVLYRRNSDPIDRMGRHSR